MFAYLLLLVFAFIDVCWCCSGRIRTYHAVAVKEDKSSWMAADDYCLELLGGHLATITNAYDMDNAISARFEAGLVAEDLWIGLYDIFADSQGWMWMDQTTCEISKVCTDDWDSNEPRDMVSGTNQQLCGVLIGDTDRYKNANCDEDKWFLCNVPERSGYNGTTLAPTANPTPQPTPTRGDPGHLPTLPTHISGKADFINEDPQPSVYRPLTPTALPTQAPNDISGKVDFMNINKDPTPTTIYTFSLTLPWIVCFSVIMSLCLISIISNVTFMYLHYNVKIVDSEATYIN